MRSGKILSSAFLLLLLDTLVCASGWCPSKVRLHLPPDDVDRLLVTFERPDLINVGEEEEREELMDYNVWLKSLENGTGTTRDRWEMRLDPVTFAPHDVPAACDQLDRLIYPVCREETNKTTRCTVCMGIPGVARREIYYVYLMVGVNMCGRSNAVRFGFDERSPPDDADDRWHKIAIVSICSVCVVGTVVAVGLAWYCRRPTRKRIPIAPKTGLLLFYSSDPIEIEVYTEFIKFCEERLCLKLREVNSFHHQPPRLDGEGAATAAFRQLCDEKDIVISLATRESRGKLDQYKREDRNYHEMAMTELVVNPRLRDKVAHCYFPLLTSSADDHYLSADWGGAEGKNYHKSLCLMSDVKRLLLQVHANMGRCGGTSEESIMVSVTAENYVDSYFGQRLKEAIDRVGKSRGEECDGCITATVRPNKDLAIQK